MTISIIKILIGDDLFKRKTIRYFLLFIILIELIFIIGDNMINSKENDIQINDGQNYFEEKLDINSASVDDLCVLDGIGPKIAQNIIDYRNKNGDFKDITQLKNVKGIGDKKLEKIKDKIIIK